MKVKLLVPISGTKGSFGAGDIIELSDAEAQRFIDALYAVSAEEPKAKTKAKSK